MENVGEILKNTRIEKGYTFEQIENYTKISKRYLEAMENEEWDILPGDVYLKGFLKTYCRYLGLDEKELLTEMQYNSEPEIITQNASAKIDMNVIPRKKMKRVLGIIAIILLLMTSYFYKNYLLPFTDPQGSSTATGEEELNKTPNGEIPLETETPTNPKEEIIGIALNIRSINQACWVKVKDGSNKILFEGTITNGQELDFTNLQKVTFTLGDAGQVEVTMNGNNLGVLGKSGEIVTKTYIFEGKEIEEMS